jgi:hypothetical protein
MKAKLALGVAAVLWVLLLPGCGSPSGTHDTAVVYGSAYYGYGPYDPWYYGGAYPPPVVVTPPVERPPHVDRPVARPTPLPAPSIPSTPRPAGRRR